MFRPLREADPSRGSDDRTETPLNRPVDGGAPPHHGRFSPPKSGGAMRKTLLGIAVVALAAGGIFYGWTLRTQDRFRAALD